MPQYLSPGVYIEEVPSGNQPIVGVSTSTAGIVGMAERGPLNIPILVTSFADYQQWFGGYLPITEFSNGSVAHCYMPHAVEGFFTNGGSLAYITRVIDPSAPYAFTQLFDRGEPDISPLTLLLRRAAANTGTQASGYSLCFLDDTGLTTSGNYFRVGTGSNSEYKQLQSASSENAMVALDFPLNRSHAAGATISDYIIESPPPAASITKLVIEGNGLPIPAGEISLQLNSTLASDVTYALGLALPYPIMVGYDSAPQFRREYRFVTNIIKINANAIEVVLDSPLTLGYSDQTPISWITLQTPALSTNTLGDDVSAGDSLIFASSELIAFQSTADLIVINDISGATTPEIRRIGQLAQLGLSVPCYADYPAGSVVEEDGIPGDYALAFPATSGDSQVVLASGSVQTTTSLTIINGSVVPAVAETLKLNTASVPATSEVVIVPAPGLLFGHAADTPVQLNLVLAAEFISGTFAAQFQDTAGITVGSTIVFSNTAPASTDSLVVVGVNTFTDEVTFKTAPGASYPAPPVPPGPYTVTVYEALSLVDKVQTAGSVIVLAGYHGLGAQLSLTIQDGSDTETFTLANSTVTATVLSLSSALANSYPVLGTIVTAAAVLTAEVAPAARSITISNDDGLVPGMQIVIDSNGVSNAPETVFIRTITPNSATTPAPYTITISPATLNSHSANSSLVEPAPMTLTSAVVGGTASNVLSVNSRMGISVGDLLQIGASPSQEYATVMYMPLSATPPIAPNAGTIILSTALQQSYLAGTAVQWVGTPPAINSGSVEATATPIDTPAGSYVNGDGAAFLLVNDGSLNSNPFQAGDIIRVTIPTGQTFFHKLSANAALATPGEVYVQAPVLERAHAAGQPIVGRNPLIKVQALDPGAWGNRLQVSIQDEPSGLVSNTLLSTIIDSTHIKLLSPAGVQVGTILELSDPAGKVYLPDLKVDAFSQSDFTITLQSPLTTTQTSAQAAAANGLNVRSREFQLTVNLLVRPNVAIPSRSTQVQDSEVFRWLSMDPRHSNYVQTIIGAIDGPLRLSDNRPEGQSNYIRVQDLTPGTGVRLGPEVLTDTLPDGRTRAAVQYLENGDDAINLVDDDTYVGTDSTDPVKRTGLYSLENIDTVSIIACPGQVRPVIQQALIDQSESMLYRMAVLDGPPPPNDTLSDVQAQRQNFDTEYAALYHPWLLIPDPFPTNLNNIAQFPIPPSGHTMGVYARVDDTRGVFKAPANELLNGITGLQRTLNKGEQDILNPFPVNINVNRDFRSTNRGIRIYGARIISSDSDWKYVPVRRLMMYIEQSLYQGLQWVVFEPNDQRLWARVRRTVSDFLKVVWRNGGLEGSKPEEAFYVLCDQTTMTQTEIDNGELIILVGVAPVMPAEFVIVRIGLWTSNAS